MVNKMLKLLGQKLSSRKYASAVLGTGLVVSAEGAGVDVPWKPVCILMTYILAEAVVDAVRMLK